MSSAPKHFMHQYLTCMQLSVKMLHFTLPFLRQKDQFTALFVENICRCTYNKLQYHYLNEDAFAGALTSI